MLKLHISLNISVELERVITQVVININTFTSAIYATKKPVHHDLICQKHIQALESVLHPRILDNNL